MSSLTSPHEPQVIGGEWITFPGGELEGKRPRALCPGCRAKLQQLAAAEDVDAGPQSRMCRTVCFQCYRAGLERARALQAAREIDTASEVRFQALLPFEPVNRLRLASLRAERERSQAADRMGMGQYAHRGRQAQIAARRELQRMTADCDEAHGMLKIERARFVASAIHAAELQLPDSWVPFVVSR